MYLPNWYLIWIFQYLAGFQEFYRLRSVVTPRDRFKWKWQWGIALRVNCPSHLAIGRNRKPCLWCYPELETRKVIFSIFFCEDLSKSISSSLRKENKACKWSPQGEVFLLFSVFLLNLTINFLFGFFRHISHVSNYVSTKSQRLSLIKIPESERICS